MLVLWSSGIALSQTITNVKNGKVLLELGAETWDSGDRVFALDEQGKRKALIQIRQIKNGKAIGEIVKGAATIGMSLKLSKKTGDSSGFEETGAAAASGGSSDFSRSRKVRSAWGLSFSTMMNTMKISDYNQNNQTYSFQMTGTNFGAGAFYDYPLTNELFVRGHGTLEMFDVKKKVTDVICDNKTSTNCNANFLQLGGYGTFNYAFSPGPYRLWAGAGGGAMIYLSKKSTVLETSKFFFNTVLVGAFGLDFFTNRKTFFPIAVEYQMIPDKEAAVSSLVLRAGWGQSF